MSSKKLTEREIREIEEAARHWGKLLAREAFPGGPDLTTTLADMEEVAMRAARALVGSAVETAVGDQAVAFGEVADCPQCGRSHPIERRTREVTIRGGTAILEEPVGHCSACRRDFFPST
jgi:YgiT-type zinc finger domain-containing protein